VTASCAADGIRIQVELHFSLVALPLTHKRLWKGIPPRKVRSMSANDVGFAIFVVFISLAAILRLYRIRRTKMNLPIQVTQYGSQTICPACGSITARAKAYCLHCGKRVRDP